MSGGGKGGETSQEIDPSLTAAARDALDFAAAGAAVPFSPNRGVTIADFTPQQKAAMQTSNVAANAFGLPTAATTGMPAAQTSATGITGFSSAAEFDSMKNKSMSTGLQSALAKLFADPSTGEFSGPSGPLHSDKYASMGGTSGGGK